MFKTITLLSLILTIKCSSQDYYSDSIQVLTNFFIERHIHTITAATCWPSEVNVQLLKKLSAIDKSLSFCLQFKPQTHVTWYRHGFIVDLSCNKSINFIHKISKERIFDLQNDWVFFNGHKFSNNQNTLTMVLNEFETYLGNSYVLPDSGIFLLQETEHGVWDIWSGFRASKSDAIRVFRAGVVSIDRIEIYDLIDQKTDFRGVELKATTVILEPDNFFGFDQKITTGLDVYTYMHYPMINILAHQLNFNFSLTVTNDHGYSYGNGSFFGLTGILQREESDFGAAGSLMRLDRMTVVDYTVGTVTLESNILFKQPKLSSVKNIHIQPFRFEVWMTTLLILIGFVSIIVFLNRFDVNGRQSSLTPLDVIELVHGAICQQGMTNVLNGFSMKVVIFVLFLTAVFLFNAYSAKIVSLFQTTSVSIKFVKDILKEKSMTMSIQISPFAKPYFNETRDPIIRKLYETKIMPYYESDLFTDAAKGIERIRTEFHGFMVEKTSAYRVINKEWQEDEKCGLYEIQLFKLPVLSIPVIKKSGHRDVFKQKLIQQQEVGISRRFIEQWTPLKPICDSTKRNRHYVSVSVKEIYPTLQLFGYGIFVSFVILVLELVYYHALVNYLRPKYRKKGRFGVVKSNAVY